MHQAQLPCHLNSRASKKVVVGDIVWVWTRVLKMSQWFELEILWKEGMHGPVGCKEMHIRGVCFTTSDLEKKRIVLRNTMTRTSALHTPTWVHNCWPIEGIYFNLLGVADGWARKGSRVRRKSSTVPEKVALVGLCEFKSHQSNVIAQRVLEKGCGGHHFTDGAHDSLLAVCRRSNDVSLFAPIDWIYLWLRSAAMNIYRPDVPSPVSLKTWVKNTGDLNFVWIFISEVFLNAKRSKREVGVGDL